MATEPISEDDARKFFDAKKVRIKKVRIKCELCEATSWLIYPDQQVERLTTAMVICGNCGNLRWHLVAAIRRWKEKGH